MRERGRLSLVCSMARLAAHQMAFTYRDRGRDKDRISVRDSVSNSVRVSPYVPALIRKGRKAIRADGGNGLLRCSLHHELHVCFRKLQCVLAGAEGTAVLVHTRKKVGQQGPRA